MQTELDGRRYDEGERKRAYHVLKVLKSVMVSEERKRLNEERNGTEEKLRTFKKQLTSWC